MVDDPAVKAELQAQMLTLAKTPVPGFKEVSNQLYGSAANPVVVDVSSDSDVLEEDVEDQQYKKVTEYLSDESEAGADESETEAEGAESSTWAKQVTLYPNP